MRGAVTTAASGAKIERLEAALLRLPQVVAPLVHRFGPGVYLREVTMPAGAVIVGHKHKTEHFNVVLSGRAEVVIDGVSSVVKAGDVFLSGAGVRKALHIIETMRWITIHPTQETDADVLEETLIEKSAEFKRVARIQNKLQKEIK